MSEAEKQRQSMPPEALKLFEELESSKTQSEQGYLVLDDLLTRQGLSVEGLYLLMRSFVDFGMLETWTIKHIKGACFITYKLSLAAA
ncbi:hypothetical protein [uncultured Endozoicomonas sp.]|uniref:hypothetical protein n=1 Tax=uncultured Endozoicomonas sp. TaxID=432652 RepID=UPI00260423F0|nr:hypothetical protein [uncultured Endozoicomonas sp.]